MFFLLLLFTLLLNVNLPFISGENVPLTLFEADKRPLAKCLDGSPAGYYLQEASDEKSKTKWVIYLAGGGECDTEEYCLEQTKNAHGSSKYFNKQKDAYEWYLGSDDCHNNPNFCTWNHVLNPYCTQDMHSGQVKEATSATWNLYFSGHHVINAILDEMDDHPNNLKDATEIIILGASAGGIGTWLHIDYIAQRYPNARVTAITIAGHYFYANYYTGPNSTTGLELTDFTESGIEFAFNLYDSFVDESCELSYIDIDESASPCLLSTQSFPHISSQVFVVQSQTDSIVLTRHDNWPEQYMNNEPEQEFMKEWHQNMTNALIPLEESSKNGYFTAACYTHTSFQSFRPSIGGVGYMEAFGNFYYNLTSSLGYKLSDDCGEMCNPTCV